MAAAFFLIGTSQGSNAESNKSLQARFSSDRLGHMEPGTYLAGESDAFELTSDGSSYFLRYSGSPEVFVLSAENAPMGARVFRYDSGETALQVSGWGGVTLYTDRAPKGLPALRTGLAQTPSLPPVAPEDIRAADTDMAALIGRVDGIDLSFSLDWSNVPESSAARSLALDAIENIARGIERMGRWPRWRQALSRRISEIMLTEGPTPAVKLSGRKLLITFNPDKGYEGRASSRSIVNALGTLLKASTKQS